MGKRRPPYHWSEREIAVIADNYAKHTMASIRLIMLQRFGWSRGLDTLYKKANELGLRKTNRPQMERRKPGEAQREEAEIRAEEQQWIRDRERQREIVSASAFPVTREMLMRGR